MHRPTRGRLLIPTLLAGAALALGACGSDTTAGTSSSASSSSSSTSAGGGSVTAAALAGTFTGTWTNETFAGSQGTIKVELTVTGSIAGAKVTVTGPIMGGTAPNPVTFDGSVTATSIYFTGTKPTYGTCNMTIALPSGSLTGSCINVPSARVDSVTVSGTLAATGTSNLTYTVKFKAGNSPATAKGSFTLTKS